MSVRIAGIDFDNVLYDGDVDVLYLTVGEPRPASDFDASPEGDYVRYDERGGLFGVSIVNARRRLEPERKITITLRGPASGGSRLRRRPRPRVVGRTKPRRVR